VTSAVLDEAASGPPTLVLAHHPLLLAPAARAHARDRCGRPRAARRVASGVAVTAAHTNLDAADDGAGTSDPVVTLLGLTSVEPLCPPAVPGGRAMGRVGDLPGPTGLRALARRIAEELPAPAARICGDAGRVVHRVAVLGGSGASAASDALAAGADVLVTGDVRHHAALDALELGLALIDAGTMRRSRRDAAFAARIAAAGAAGGLDAAVVLSVVSTDPWEPA
jgi:dinuclear metal center YbgI/SA1388 family protein